MSSEFTTIIRYVPIITLNEQYRQQNSSFGVFASTNIPVNLSTRPPRYISLIESANILLIALLAILLAMVLISYTWLRRAPAPLKMMAAVIAATGEEKYISFLHYTYTGIKSALHDLYVKLRRTYCKPSCTPREVAERAPNLAKFAEVYEDVVYGDKYSEELKKDVDEVLNCCRS